MKLKKFYQIAWRISREAERRGVEMWIEVDHEGNPKIVLEEDIIEVIGDVYKPST